MKEMLIDSKEKTSPVWLDVQVEGPLESNVMSYFTLQEEKGKKKAQNGVLITEGSKASLSLGSKVEKEK